MKLKRKEIIVDLSFHFQNNDYGMKGCDERKGIMLWSLKLRGDFGTSWEGEVGEGGYNIMDEQVYQDTLKSTTPFEDGDRILKRLWCGFSSGSFMSVINGGKWWRNK
jgi:hypothetical protein